MSDYLNRCKRRAKQIKADYPDACHMQRLDIAAKELGFRHYTDLKRITDKPGIDTDRINQ